MPEFKGWLWKMAYYVRQADQTRRGSHWQDRMSEAPRSANEPLRLAALRALHILDTPPDERFNRIARTASRLFQTPIALVSLEG